MSDSERKTWPWCNLR